MLAKSLKMVNKAAERIPALETVRATWFEEPFNTYAYHAYSSFAKFQTSVKLAGGEGAHNVQMANHLIEYGKVGYIQIDCGRIGGISPGKKIAEIADKKGITYVNHTFTSHLALSASLQPFAGLADHKICEYPANPKRLAYLISSNYIEQNKNGEISAPNEVGLGIDVNLKRLKSFLIDTEIRINRKVIYKTPSLN